MSSLKTRPLVVSRWLLKQLSAETAQVHHKGAPHLTVLDATSGVGKDPNSFISKHIPTAQFFDQNRCAIREEIGSLPEPECFSAYAQALGVSRSRQVVLYDRGGMASAARAWLTFRAYGHKRVSVLDGGLTRWSALGLPTKSNHVKQKALPGDFTVTPRPDLTKDMAAMQRLLEDGEDVQVVDARSPRSYWGEDPEPSRPTTTVLRSRGLPVPADMWRGHLPGSVNLPAGHLLAHDGTLRTLPELQANFRAAGVDLSRPLVTMCYNGDMACLVALAAAVCGNSEAAVYLGSWTEWGQHAEPHHVTTGKDHTFHLAL